MSGVDYVKAGAVVNRSRLGRGQRGLSLVELMFALGIIAVALMGIMSMIITSATNKERMRELMVAKEAAALKIEEIKSQQFAQITTLYGSPNNLFNVTGLSDPTNTAGSKRGRGEIRILTTNPNLLDITVAINWSGAAKNGSYSMRSLYSR